MPSPVGPAPGAGIPPLVAFASARELPHLSGVALTARGRRGGHPAPGAA
jgi:hypothetical protein